MSLQSASKSQPTVLSSVDTTLWKSKEEQKMVESFHALSYALLCGWLYLVTNYNGRKKYTNLICGCTVHQLL